MSTTAASIPCPDCGVPLQGGVSSCPACGLPLTGPAAARLWQVDQELVALQAERSQLLVALRGDPAANGAVAPAVPTGPARRRAWTPQELLLVTGVALVLVAGLVFLAVAWSVIGVAGQVTAMVGAAVASGVAAARLSSRGLRSTGEALAVVATGLLAVDLAAAHRLDLAGLGGVRDADYITGAAAVAACILGLAALLAPQLRTFAIATVAAAALLPLAALTAVEAGVVATAAVLLASAAALAVARVRILLGASAGAARLTARLFEVTYLGVGALAAVSAVFDGGFASPPSGTPNASAALLVAAAAVVLMSFLALRATRVEATPQGAPHAAVPALLYGAGATLTAAWTFTGVAWHAGATGLLVSGLIAAAVAAGAVAASGRLDLPGQVLGALAVVGHMTVAAAAMMLLLGDVDGFGRPAHPVFLGFTLAAASGAAAYTTWRMRRWVLLGAPYSALTALAAAGAVSVHAPTWLQAAAVAAVASAVAWVAGRSRAAELEVVLLVVTAAGFAAALLVAADAGDAVAASVTFAIAGLTALAYSAVPGRGLLAYLGVLSCSAATWVLFLDQDIEVIEAYSLPLAALAAGVGAVVLRRRPSAASWEVAGPALSAALLPSALATVGDPALARPLAVVAAGVVAVLFGLRWHWQSPVVVGSVALLVVALSQAAPYAVGAPRWFTLGIAGVLLLVLGARYERARDRAGDALRWVTSLR